VGGKRFLRCRKSPGHAENPASLPGRIDRRLGILFSEFAIELHYAECYTDKDSLWENNALQYATRTTDFEDNLLKGNHIGLHACLFFR
jgi:hypothetical protein